MRVLLLFFTLACSWGAYSQNKDLEGIWVLSKIKVDGHDIDNKIIDTLKVTSNELRQVIIQESESGVEERLVFTGTIKLDKGVITLMNTKSENHGQSKVIPEKQLEYKLKRNQLILIEKIIYGKGDEILKEPVFSEMRYRRVK